jgi:hypothetical protein
MSPCSSSTFRHIAICRHWLCRACLHTLYMINYINLKISWSISSREPRVKPEVKVGPTEHWRPLEESREVISIVCVRLEFMPSPRWNHRGGPSTNDFPKETDQIFQGVNFVRMFISIASKLLSLSNRQCFNRVESLTLDSLNGLTRSPVCMCLYNCC